MNKYVLMATGLTLTIVAGFVLWPAQNSYQKTSDTTSELPPKEISHVSTYQAKSTTHQPVQEKPDTKSLSRMSAESDSEALSNSPLETPQFKQQLSELAQEYAAQSRFPPFSQPITSEEQLKSLKPNRAFPVDLPFPVADHENPLMLSIEVDKHVYFRGESIPIVAAVSGQDAKASLSASIRLTSVQGEAVYEATMDEDSQTSSLFSAIVNTSQEVTEQWPEELQIHVYVQVGSHRLNGVMPVRLHSPSALVTGTEPSRIEEEYLIIPVNFRVFEKGYYFLTANLYDKATGDGLVHLESEGQLKDQQDSLKLKAHITALKIKGKEGPYLLGDISVLRMGNDEEVLDYPGMANASDYPVEGYPFNEYQDKPYQDPLAAERAEFLSQLSK